MTLELTYQLSLVHNNDAGAYVASVTHKEHSAIVLMQCNTLTCTHTHTHTHTHTQSLTVPLQGFLNAMVYGWTRDDFVKAVVNNPTDSLNTSISPSSYHGNDEPPSSDEEYEDQRTLVQTIPDLEGLKSGGEQGAVFSNETQTDLQNSI